MTEFASCKLCRGIQPQEMEAINRQVVMRTKEYGKGEIIAFEGDECSALGVLLDGIITIQRLLPSGKRVVMDTLQPGDSFGEVIIFSDVQVYPASIIVGEYARVVFLSKENVLRLCLISSGFLTNFMTLLSNKIWMLNRKVKSLSYQSVRQKTVNFLLEAYTRQKKPELHFNISRLEMADQLGLPRPSLSRELAGLKDAGWIDYAGDTIRLLDLSSLEDCLMEG